MNNIMRQLDSLSAVAGEIASAFPQFCRDGIVTVETIGKIKGEFDLLNILRWPDSSARPAAPIVKLGDEVNYIDHHDRPQQGQVLSITAEWQNYRGDEADPFIVYCVSHPTYNRRQHYTAKVTRS